MSAWLCDPRLALCLWIVSGHLDFPPGVLSCLKPRNLCPGLSLSLCVYQRERTGGRAALMRINLWIVLVVLMALNSAFAIPARTRMTGTARLA
jgi:hypothetical protein